MSRPGTRPPGSPAAAGSRASASDPLQGLKVTGAGFHAMAAKIAGLGLPTVLVQEGGYLSDELGGNLVQFLFRNPHSFVHVEAPDEKGSMQRWAVEWGAGLQLNRQGVTRETLHPGDHVIITGNPGRNPEDHRMRTRTISRPSDGWKWGGTFD